MQKFYGERYYWSETGLPGEELSLLLSQIEYSSAGLVVDNNIPDAWLTNELRARTAFCAPLDSGEVLKSISSITSFVADYQRHLDIDSLLLIVGGGATLDAIGLCCALLYRGIRYLSVPTSVIGMADAAYGGKTAINLGVKNQLGVYHHPTAVYANVGFLGSLPVEHARAGMVEVVKLGFFYEDLGVLLDQIDGDLSRITPVLRLAARRKLELLTTDPYEREAGSVLLYGHPFSNAFETFASSRSLRPLPHGAAVALGISFTAWLGEHLSGTTGHYDQRMAALMRWLDVPAYADDRALPGRELMGDLLLRDKYAAGDRMRIPALDSATGYTTVPLSQVLQEYCAWRSHMLPTSVGDKALVRRPEATRVSRHLYISGRPDDETVADLHFREADRSFLVTST